MTFFIFRASFKMSMPYPELSTSWLASSSSPWGPTPPNWQISCSLAQILLVPYSSFLLDFLGYHDFFTLLCQASFLPPFLRPKTYLPFPVSRTLIFHFFKSQTFFFFHFHELAFLISMGLAPCHILDLNKAKLSCFSVSMGRPFSFLWPSSLSHFGP